MQYMLNRSFFFNIMAKDGGIAMSRGHTFIYLL